MKRDTAPTDAPPQDHPRILFDDIAGGLHARAVAGRGSDVLAVVFSQVRVPAGAFGLSRLFARTSHAALFLNQPENAWYRDADDAVDAAIAAARSAVRPGRVVFYGSSMGGTGALAAGARHPEARVIAYAPDFRPGEPGSQSAAAGLLPRAGEPSVADLVAARRTGAVTVLTGLFDPYDAGVASRLAVPAADGMLDLVTVASGHEIHDHLYALNVVRRIIATFTRSPADAVAARGVAAVLDPVRHGRFAALARALGCKDRPSVADVRALGLDGNPGVALLEADLLEAEGDLDGAERCLRALQATIAASPVLSGLPKRYRKAVPRRRIDLLERLGRADDARAVAVEAARAFPEDAGFAARVLGAPDADTGLPERNE